MTFEEFFKKKKIDLGLLNAAEPTLFAEFELHYNLMGEKSFDHTKKYLFNPLRRKYHTPEEVKIEKVVIENQLAEQTITEALTNAPEATPAPKVGFTPRFKAPITTPAPMENIPSPSEIKAEPANETPAPKIGFKPRFNAAAMAKPTVETPAVAEEKAEPATETAPKVGFKPRFNATAMAKPAQEAPIVTEEKAESTSETPAPKIGFKPRFNAAKMAKPVEDIPVAPDQKGNELTTEAPAPKLGFKPKFRSAPAPKINSDDEALSGDTNEAPPL